MIIVNMKELSKAQIEEAALILTSSIPIGWPTLADALEELVDILVPGNTLMAAVEDEKVLGFGGILAPTYSGNVFELHPLAVREDRRGQGIGEAIVTSLEAEARRQGGKTIHLGADDERGDGETSLANVDLFDDLPEKLKNFSPGTHQAKFYLKLGYKIIGVMPDANGLGKPDIYFGKRL